MLITNYLINALLNKYSLKLCKLIAKKGNFYLTLYIYIKKY